MYVILKKISIKHLKDQINSSLKHNNKALEKELETIKRFQRRSEILIDQLINEKYRDDLKIQYMETILKEIHEKTVENGKCCPICGSEFPIFLPFGHPIRENAQCPVCNSLERDRASYLFLKEQTDIFNKKVSILHFAPEKSLSKRFKENESIDYLPVDINPEMENVVEKMDIQNIERPDNSFDMVYCSHVLEHVPNDNKAMSEIYRVIKPGGFAMIMVPLDPSLSKTLEDPSYNTPELRTKYYGQHDHLRYYGPDFPNKLEDVGFKVSSNFYETKNEEYLNKYGLKTYHYMYMCSK